MPNLTVLHHLSKTDENWELAPELSQVFFSTLLADNDSKWLVIFPEVNIFTEADLNLQKIQSKKFYLPKFHHLLYPRFSAFYNVMMMAQSKENHKFMKLYDITLWYTKLDANGESVDFRPDLMQIFSSDERITVHVHCRLKQLSRISNKRPKIERWLEKEWLEKDKILERSVNHSGQS